MAAYLVLGLRLVVPLSIFRWPLAGAALSIAADALDSVIFRNFGWGVLHPADYQLIDKYLDLYYVTFEAIAVSRWRDLLWRRIGMFLFIWRFAGILLFEITGVRQILFFAPNVFENFYLLILLLGKLSPSGFKTYAAAYAFSLIMIAAIPKITQEYVMHYRGYPLGMGAIFKSVQGVTNAAYRTYTESYARQSFCYRSHTLWRDVRQPGEYTGSGC